jgi:putative (di)nucleoside polyphosphate hydrolase
MTLSDFKNGDQSAMEGLPYRPGVGIMLLNKHNQVFVARRINFKEDAWQMPQGGIDSGENPRQAALRELKEETGTDLVEIMAESKEWLQYDLPSHLISKIWKGRFRGQRQKWFVLRFLGEDRDINIHTDEPEFDAWKWTDPIDLPGLIVPFKKGLYEKVIEDFSSVISGSL